MKTRVALLFAFLLAQGIAAAQAPLSPADVLAHGASYDGKQIAIAGTVAKIEHRTSHHGNAYTTFDLCDGSSCIHVFEFGAPELTAGQTLTVRGRFSLEKHVGTAVYRNELDAASGR